MIVTDLINFERQVPLTPAIRKAVEFLRRPDLAMLPDGKVEIDGEKVFALPQRYETAVQPSPKFEYHRKYVDIQFLVEGEEVIAWAPAERLTITEPYDRQKDITFGTAKPEDVTNLRLKGGRLAVLYPEDGHAPKLAAGAPAKVFKIVVKVIER
jgi:YhcH/YjgK/YiaL family protein